MKKFRHAFCVLFVAFCACAVRAQKEDDSSIPDYTPTADDDLVLYIPKHSVRLGFRALSGAKTSFGGQGLLMLSTQSIGAETGVANRIYSDGSVSPDGRTLIDPSGNTVPIAPDGRTNTWSFIDSSQGTEVPGFIAMHAYSAKTTDASFHEKDPSLALGVEIASEREMGKVFGSRMKWGLIAGLSVNQIYATTSANLAADVTTTRDLYSLGGQAAPDVSSTPYVAPVNSGGVDVSVLLGDQPLDRSTKTASIANEVLSTWKLRGAYVTMRAGPTLYLPVTSRFSATFSAGAVLVYAGTTYEVTQSFKPETGDEVSQFVTNTKNALLPGFYVDADLQFAMTDTSGLYLGAVYQNSGDYVQTVSSTDGLSTYMTRVDLSSLQGIRAGVSFKF